MLPEVRTPRSGKPIKRSAWRCELSCHRTIAPLIAAALVACGGSPPEEVGAQSEDLKVSLPPVVAEMYCPEVAAAFPIDPVVARELVPLDYELDLLPDGMAYLNVVLEDCSQLDLDGVPHAPLHNVLLWSAVTGPFENIEVPGTVESWDTAYWYNLNNFSTDHGLGDMLNKYGFPSARLASLDLPPLAEVRTASRWTAPSSGTAAG